MISDYALSNWDHYLKITPKHALGLAPPTHPRGAYDARGGAIAHGFGRAISTKDFERGGVYDYRGRFARDEQPSETVKVENVLKLFRHLAKTFSDNEWMDLKKSFGGYKDDADAEDSHGLETLPTRKPDSRPNNRVNQLDSEASRQAMDELHERVPGLKNIKVGTGDRLQEIDPRCVLNQKTPVAMDSVARQRVVEGIEKFAPGFAAVKIGTL